MTALLGVTGGGCTCRVVDGLHQATCRAVAAGQVHAMVDDAGGVFYPDGPEDARMFAEDHGARPLHPDRFPPGWLP